MERRDLVKMLATLPLGAWALSADNVADAAEHAAHAIDALDTQAQAFTPKFFTSLEWRTVRVLADIVIPRDAKSGSATEAGVPQLMDFVMTEYPTNQARMREGLGWLNAEARTRFGKPFPDLAAAERIAIVEDIAWPSKAKPEMAAGVRFFNAFRDLTGSGFFSSRVGIADIGYMGNRPQSAWSGCSTAAEKHIGV